jgi:hypothetical protein
MMAETEFKTAAEKRLEAQKRRWYANLSVPTVQDSGVSTTTLDLEREALDYCKARGHKLRENGTQACRTDLQDALMGRLGQERGELPPLPPSVTDKVARHIDELLADGGRWGLAELLFKVNERRHAKGQGPTTETTCSARIRDLRKVGRVIHQADLPGGGAEYWMDRA